MINQNEKLRMQERAIMARAKMEITMSEIVTKLIKHNYGLFFNTARTIENYFKAFGENETLSYIRTKVIEDIKYFVEIEMDAWQLFFEGYMEVLSNETK